MSEQYAVIFPGQGSQKVGMLADLAVKYPLVTNTFMEASDVLGYDLWRLVQEGPAEKLNQTEYTQPALVAAEIAMWRIYCSHIKILPKFLAGHSLGEYAALVAAQAIGFQDALTLVAERGKIMQQAKGGMAAIVGLDDEDVIALCQEVAEGEVVSPANFNAYGQIVLAGNLGALNRAIVLAKERGAKLARLLPVSVPAHSILMHSLAEEVSVILDKITIHKPVVPVIQNFAVKAYSDPETIRAVLVKQIYNPVRWVETIEFFVNNNIDYLVECGPGKVLAGLNKRITADLATLKVTQLIEE